MSSENALLTFYRGRLLRREMSLLGAYASQGRSPRISHFAYWRASFIPLAVPLAFFFARQVGVPELQATLIALSLFLGLIFADIQLFVMNSATWIFAKKTLNWAKVRDMARAFGADVHAAETATASSRWDQIEVPASFLQNMAKSYQKMRQSPPDLNQLIFSSLEARSLLISTVILLIVLRLSPDLMAFALPVFLFVTAWPAKRLKAALDFRVTWPVLQQAFDWDNIDQLANGIKP